MKSYYFISGLPRSGSTLLSAILRQNPKFHGEITSPIQTISELIIKSITISENNFCIGEEQRKNLIYGIFEGYYKNIDNPIIFDTNRFWTKKTSLLKTLFPYTKILCTVRDIVSILNSFENILSKNSLYFNVLTKYDDNVFQKCDEFMNKDDGLIFKSLIFLKEGYAINPEMMHFIEYENLCKEPETTMKKVYEFLEMPYYHHDFNNVEYSNEDYDKNCNLKDLHTVRKKVEYKPPRCVLPPEIVKKYKEMNMEFWSSEYKPDANIIQKLDKKFIDYK